MARLEFRTYFVEGSKELYAVYAIAPFSRDVNGNPRYFVKSVDLGLETNKSTKETKALGLRSAQDGFTFTSYNIEATLSQFLKASLYQSFS